MYWDNYESVSSTQKHHSTGVAGGRTAWSGGIEHKMTHVPWEESRRSARDGLPFECPRGRVLRGPLPRMGIPAPQW